MKLQTKKSKSLTALLIVVAAIVVIGIIVGGVVIVNDIIADSKVRYEMIINVPPRTTYFVDEEFDPTGMRVKIAASNNKDSYYVDTNKLTFSGFDSSVPNEELVVTVHYKEFSQTFIVKIKEPITSTAPTLESIRLSQDLSFSLAWWNRFGPNLEGVMLICKYSDDTEVEVPMDSTWCTITRPLSSTGTTDMLVKYTDEEGRTAEATFPITITN